MVLRDRREHSSQAAQEQLENAQRDPGRPIPGAPGEVQAEQYWPRESRLPQDVEQCSGIETIAVDDSQAIALGADVEDLRAATIPSCVTSSVPARCVPKDYQPPGSQELKDIRRGPERARPGGRERPTKSRRRKWAGRGAGIGCPGGFGPLRPDLSRPGCGRHADVATEHVPTARLSFHKKGPGAASHVKQSPRLGYGSCSATLNIDPPRG